MKKTLLILFLLFSIFSYSSETNGNVFLDNTSDHSGIIIKFNPVSPSAVYTEGPSDSNGAYNITVINGVYNVSYEKNGYQTYTITDQLISNDNTLTDVTLNSNTAVSVSGNVSGNWTNSNTYIVNGDITVPSGQTLNIEQGTEIKFDGYYSLIINGTLKAIGSENNIIKFTSIKTSPTNKDWKGIQINDINTMSELKYCIIEYGNDKNNDQTGLIEIKGDVKIENSKIRHSSGVGVRISHNHSGDVTVKNSEIHDCTSGVYSSGSGQLIVDDSSIYDISEIGIRSWPDSEYTAITNNRISQCLYGINSIGDILINRNIIFDNSFYGLFVLDGKASIQNNTFLSNKNSIGITENDFYNPDASINSNIFLNTVELDIRSLGDFKPSLVAYNLFYNNSGIGNNLPVGVGSVITTNINGTDSDTYFNIFSPPNLISFNPSDENFCKLDTNSDAINAGDPNITNNYNSTVIDIGVKESSVTLSINEFANSSFSVFPNPIISQVKIQANDSQLFNKIILYNINGQVIKEHKLENLSNEYTLENLNHLNSGIYIMKIFNKLEKSKEIKLLKK
jgi:hypothetical protein